MVKAYVKPRDGVLYKIDAVSQRLFFHNALDVPLEVIVEDEIKGALHHLSTRGNYLMERRRVAFQRMPDEVSLDDTQPLDGHYATAIEEGLDPRTYVTEREGNRLVVRAKLSRREIETAIQSYIDQQGGHLNQRQFIELTGATEAQLVQLFGPEHDTITRRQYGMHDVLRYSNRFFGVSVPRRWKGKDFWNKKTPSNANIMNIYRKAIRPRQRELF